MKKQQLKFSKEPAFINREKEMSFLQQWINERPGSMLFIYLIMLYIQPRHLSRKRFVHLLQIIL